MAIDYIGANDEDGMTFGETASVKCSFWGADPIVQPSGADQSAVSAANLPTSSHYANSTGADGTVFGFDSTSQLTNLLGVVSSLVAAQHTMRTALVNEGLMKGSV